MKNFKDTMRWLLRVPTWLVLAGSLVGLLVVVPVEHTGPAKEGFFYLVGRVTSHHGVARLMRWLGLSYGHLPFRS